MTPQEIYIQLAYMEEALGILKRELTKLEPDQLIENKHGPKKNDKPVYMGRSNI